MEIHCEWILEYVKSAGGVPFEGNIAANGYSNKMVLSSSEMSYIYIDATCSQNSMRISFGGIVGMSSRHTLASLSRYHDLFSSILDAENIAIYEGRLARKMSISHIMILLNSLSYD